MDGQTGRLWQTWCLCSAGVGGFLSAGGFCVRDGRHVYFMRVKSSRCVFCFSGAEMFLCLQSWVSRVQLDPPSPPQVQTRSNSRVARQVNSREKKTQNDMKQRRRMVVCVYWQDEKEVEEELQEKRGNEQKVTQRGNDGKKESRWRWSGGSSTLSPDMLFFLYKTLFQKHVHTKCCSSFIHESDGRDVSVLDSSCVSTVCFTLAHHQHFIIFYLICSLIMNHWRSTVTESEAPLPPSRLYLR